jgi:pimeloyl-ACP methyl ester carboxylesterase
MEMLAVPRVTVVHGIPIAWTEMGSGPPLVLLHGLGDSHRTWRLVAPRLAKRFRVLMPDLPGHGLSGRPDAPYTLGWYAQIVLAWLDALEIERAHVVGHSFGGGVAQWLVLEARERVDRLGLVACGGFGPEVSLGLRLAAFPVLGGALAQPLMGLGTQVLMRLGGQRSSGEVARTAWMNSAPGSGMAFHRTVAGCIDLLGQHMQTWDRIHQVKELPPLAIFWGEEDPILPIAQARGACARIEGTTFFAYPRVGHFPHLEASERFVGDVLVFLGGDAVPARLSERPVAPPRTTHARVRVLARNLRGWIGKAILRRPPPRVPLLTRGDQVASGGFTLN